MSSYTKPSFGTREKLTHRVLYYLHERTSSKFPEWRDVTMTFFYELFELMNDNASLNLLFHRADGLNIYSGSTVVAYIHFRQQHFLIHAREDYAIWDAGNALFRTPRKGSYPRMWKADTSDEVAKFIEYLKGLPQLPMADGGRASRTIPVWVQEFVLERDGQKCVACGEKNNLCFDHILPFCKGGASDHPNNIQLLCSKCNLEKSGNLWPVKVQG